MDDTERIIKLKIRIDNLEGYLKSLETRVATINERTKAHTIYIKQLERKVKELSEVIRFTNQNQKGGKIK